MSPFAKQLLNGTLIKDVMDTYGGTNKELPAKVAQLGCLQHRCAFHKSDGIVKPKDLHQCLQQRAGVSKGLKIDGHDHDNTKRLQPIM